MEIKMTNLLNDLRIFLNSLKLQLCHNILPDLVFSPIAMFMPNPAPNRSKAPETIHAAVADHKAEGVIAIMIKTPNAQASIFTLKILDMELSIFIIF